MMMMMMPLSLENLFPPS